MASAGSLHDEARSHDEPRLHNEPRSHDKLLVRMVCPSFQQASSGNTSMLSSQLVSQFKQLSLPWSPYAPLPPKAELKLFGYQMLNTES